MPSHSTLGVFARAYWPWYLMVRMLGFGALGDCDRHRQAECEAAAIRQNRREGAR